MVASAPLPAPAVAPELADAESLFRDHYRYIFALAKNVMTPGTTCASCGRN